MGVRPHRRCHVCTRASRLRRGVLVISDYDALLKVIDARMLETPPRQIPHLLRNLPLAVWGELLLNIPPEYSRLKARFPSMPPDIVQDMIYAYSVFTHLSEKTVRAAFDTLRGYI